MDGRLSLPAHYVEHPARHRPRRDRVRVTVLLNVRYDASVSRKVVRHCSSPIRGVARERTQIAAVAEDLAKASQGKLPIRAFVSKIALMDNRSGRWGIRDLFSLGA